MIQPSYDTIVIGGGVLGLAHAWRAAKRGLSVALFERNSIAQGASVRNFGMIWPIGQPFGEQFQLALQSRSLWSQLAKEADFWFNPCGSLHLAHREDEWAVLQEFASIANSEGATVRLLNARETCAASPGARPEGLIGALQSPYEVAVNPVEVIQKLPDFLSQRYKVRTHFNTAVVSVEENTIYTSDGRSWMADKIIICSGSDVRTLFPSALQNDQLRLCKLQMMRTVVQPSNWRLHAHLASGLTLRHYQSFQGCPSISKLKHRIEEESPELNRFGIHVMASQNQFGEVILGDSHEYDDAIAPFDRVEIDELVLRELKKQFHLPTWQIASRWHGFYLKSSSSHVFESSPQNNVHIITGVGGAGMTLSFGLAEQTCCRLYERTTAQL